MLLYVSALFAVVLSPWCVRLRKLRIGRWQPFKGYCHSVRFWSWPAALTAFGFLALPPVIRDLQEFGREMPTRLPNLLEQAQSNSLCRPI